MNQWRVLFLISSLMALLIACSNEEPIKVTRDKAEVENIRYAKLLDKEEDEKAKDASLKDKKQEDLPKKDGIFRSGKELQSAEGKLKDEEVQAMMVYMFDEIHALTRKSSDSRNDWLTENREKAVREEAKKLEKPLANYIVKDFTNEVAAELLEYFNCECDMQAPFHASDLYSRFDVKEQKDDTIIVESITLGDGVLHGTSYGRWYLQQEDNRWKLADYEYVNYDESHDFKLTFEDIEDSFYVYDKKDEKIPVEFVEYYEADGLRYLVIRYPEKYTEDYFSGPYRVYNTFTASLEDQITREYNEKIE